MFPENFTINVAQNVSALPVMRHLISFCCVASNVNKYVFRYFFSRAARQVLLNY